MRPIDFLRAFRDVAWYPDIPSGGSAVLWILVIAALAVILFTIHRHHRKASGTAQAADPDKGPDDPA